MDRDGTLIAHEPYLADPELVRLLPGAADAVRRFGRAGFARVVITNQPAIGKGLLTETVLEEIHRRMIRLLAEGGASVDAIYYNPHVRGEGDAFTIHHPDRKPGPGMLLRAGRELTLDLSRSWCVGDSVIDVLAGRNAGCYRSILIGRDALPHGVQGVVVGDIGAAADYILSHQP